MMPKKDQETRGARELQKYVNATGSLKQGFTKINKQTQDGKRVMNRQGGFTLQSQSALFLDEGGFFRRKTAHPPFL